VSHKLSLLEICAGAGGQGLGLHQAGFDHVLAVELDANAAQTLRNNSDWSVVVGDVADPEVWDPSHFVGVDLFAGGVPCPPFSIAGKQLGSSDERDLFAWAIEQVAIIKPRALLLENVRGLASPRFAAYRQRVLDRLSEFGYVGDWRLLYSADFGVPQLRPRFVLVAMRPEDAEYFRWPEPLARRVHVGETLRDLMAANGWPHADAWAMLADGVGPTLVGGSKKHGGADLGPTRAKQAWAALAVDGRGVANEAPGPEWPHPSEAAPRLTIEMVARLQGWVSDDDWHFAGLKTSKYRQIGNAFPPPVARAMGLSIARALNHDGLPHALPELAGDVHDPLYRELAEAQDFVSLHRLVTLLNANSEVLVQRRLAVLARDFHLDVRSTTDGAMYRLGAFKGFVGQSDHDRHAYFEANRSKIS